MTNSPAHRLAIAFPLIGAAFLLVSLLLPAAFAALTWILALACFAVALTFAIIAQRQRAAVRPVARPGSSR